MYFPVLTVQIPLEESVNYLVKYVDNGVYLLDFLVVNDIYIYIVRWGLHVDVSYYLEQFLEAQQLYGLPSQKPFKKDKLGIAGEVETNS